MVLDLIQENQSGIFKRDHQLDLTDSMISLQAASGYENENIGRKGDANADRKIGMSDALYQLRFSVGL